MADDGYFNEERQEELGMTDEMNKEFGRIVDEVTKKDLEEQAKRIGDKAVYEFKKRFPDWISSE